jgi:hypothetical protein
MDTPTCLGRALLTSLLTGCAPVLHSVTLVPDIQGRLTRSGAPVANAEVVAGVNTSGNACEVKSSPQKTNVDGSFRIPAKDDLKFEYRKSTAQLAVNTWELCFRQEGATVLGFRGLNFQPRTDVIVLSCDLDKQYPQSDRGVQGVCQLVPVPRREVTGH